jgi:hypothetical protein
MKVIYLDESNKWSFNVLKSGVFAGSNSRWGIEKLIEQFLTCISNYTYRLVVGPVLRIKVIMLFVPRI